MLDYKKLPEAIPITEDNKAYVVGWVKEKSFVVESYVKGRTTEENLGLYDEPDGYKGELLSLWDWGIQNDLSLKEFSEIQKNLESYLVT